MAENAEVEKRSDSADDQATGRTTAGAPRDVMRRAGPPCELMVKISLPPSTSDTKAMREPSELNRQGPRHAPSP
jgi:hypothetical protein